MLLPAPTETFAAVALAVALGWVTVVAELPVRYTEPPSPKEPLPPIRPVSLRPALLLPMVGHLKAAADATVAVAGLHPGPQNSEDLSFEARSVAGGASGGSFVAAGMHDCRSGEGKVQSVVQSAVVAAACPLLLLLE